MFRKPFVRPMRRAVRPVVHPLLARANQFMAAGNFIAAAQAYEQLAIGAQRRGNPRDANLFLQAGRCRLLAGQVESAMINMKEGLGLFQQRGNLGQLKKSGELVIADLREKGLNKEAEEIESMLKTSIPTGTYQETIRNQAYGVEKHRLLPTNCPSCGAPLRPGEVEWLDDATADCPFCGGAVRAE